MDGLVPGKSLISDFLQAGSRDQFTSLAAGSEKKLVLPGLRRARSVQNSRLFQEKKYNVYLLEQKFAIHILRKRFWSDSFVRRGLISATARVKETRVVENNCKN